MKYTLEMIAQYVRILEEQERRFKSIASLPGKSLLDCDNNLMAAEMGRIKSCLIDLYATASKFDERESTDTHGEEPI